MFNALILLLAPPAVDRLNFTKQLKIALKYLLLNVMRHDGGKDEYNEAIQSEQRRIFGTSGRLPIFLHSAITLIYPLSNFVLRGFDRFQCNCRSSTCQSSAPNVSAICEAMFRKRSASVRSSNPREKCIRYLIKIIGQKGFHRR